MQPPHSDEGSVCGVWSGLNTVSLVSIYKPAHLLLYGGNTLNNALIVHFSCRFITVRLIAFLWLLQVAEQEWEAADPHLYSHGFHGAQRSRADGQLRGER